MVVSLTVLIILMIVERYIYKSKTFGKQDDIYASKRRHQNIHLENVNCTYEVNAIAGK